MTNQPLVSIIVPVYGAEKYLHRCLDSILAQTFTSWECILVDDGSKDRSGAICDEYAAHDQRFRVFHKVNGGVSSARQAGLELAVGNFVIHADSDDWLESNMLEELIKYQIETKAELIIFDFFRHTGKHIVRISQKPSFLAHEQVLKDIISGRVYASCWNKLIKRSVISRWRASFPKGINFGEDKCFLASILKHHVEVSYLSKPLYNYDASINDNSLVRKISKDSMRSGFAMVNYLESILDKEYEKSIYNVKRNLKIRAIYSGLYTESDIRKLYKEINKKIVFNVLKLKIHTKEDLMLFFHTLGLYGLSKLFINFTK